MVVSVRDQIKKLVDIQKLDGEIYDLNKEIKEKPERIDQLKEQFEIKKARLKELEDKVKSVVVARKDLEIELQSKENVIAKANSDLNQLKTNKEYAAKIKEIEGIKADKSIVEENILKSYDEADAVYVEIEKEKIVVSEREKEYLSKKKEIEDELNVLKDRVKVLVGQRNQIAPDIDPNILVQYEKILGHKEGRAIVPVNGTSCGGCFMNVMPQTVNQIKMKAELVRCEYCSRFIYIEEDL
ncbi:MAG: zinc ribbon domain-containing protein [Candidatus Omnitrophota bacterium]